MTSADHAEIFIHGVEIQEDPWAEPAPLDQEFQMNPARLTALYVASGVWGTFLGVMCWWSVEFVMVGESAPILALN